MIATNPDNSSKDELAQQLASLHYEDHPGISRIFRVLTADTSSEEKPDEPIKLLEVNEDTIAAGIQPLRFGPDPSGGVPYPLIVIELTPEEFEQLNRGGLELPKPWRLGSEYAPPSQRD